MSYLKITTDFDYSKITVTLTTTKFKETKNYTLNPKSPDTTIPAGTYYIAVWGDTYNYLNLKFERGDISFSKSSNNLLTIPEGKIMNLGRIGIEDYVRIRDLSEYGSANSYIVSEPSFYKFKAVKGNSSEPVGDIDKVEVLWESFGTDTAPSKGELVSNANLDADGFIVFEASDKKGNALIAAKDAQGKVLWSWHIWLTERPADQVYYNSVGTMMDRNLGATSATPGDVCALGLLYQWGRKDPFLGSSSISSGVRAASTLGNWPEAVDSNTDNGTIAYAQANPTTFIKGNGTNKDWVYGESSKTDQTRWQSSKTIYDPCPAGYKVPYGGKRGWGYGVWSGAVNTYNAFNHNFDDTNKGMDFALRLGPSASMWYPAAGRLENWSGGFSYVGVIGIFWTTTPYDVDAAICFRFYSSAFSPYPAVFTANSHTYAYALSVRCCKE